MFSDWLTADTKLSYQLNSLPDKSFDMILNGETS